MKNLIEAASGKPCRVIGIRAGRRAISNLESLGVRPGVLLTKLHAQLVRGPISVRIGSLQLAVGWGIASRIMVEEADHE